MSEGSIKEFLGNKKRKERGAGQEKEEEEERKAFLKNRKTERTPKKQRSGEGELDKLFEGLRRGLRENLKSEMGRVEEKREEVIKELERLRKRWEKITKNGGARGKDESEELQGKRIKELERKIQDMAKVEARIEGKKEEREKVERVILGTKVEELKKRIETKNRGERRKNIIIIIK